MPLHILHRVGHTRVIKCSAHTVVPSKCLPEHDDYACVAMEASTCVNHRCSTAENNCLGAIGYYATLHAHEKPSSTDTTNAFIRYHTVVVHTTYPDSRLTSVLHNFSSRRKKRPSGPMHYIRRRAPPPRPGAAAAQFSPIARPDAATARSTRVRSSTMTSRVKTRSDSIIRRLHGGVRARSALSRSAGAMPERETRDSHTV